MSVAVARETPEPDTTVPHEEWLLRLTYHPEHFENGEIRPSAVNLEDLSSRGYSVDREHLVAPATITERARDQTAKNPKDRQSSFMSRFECGPVCNEVDTAGQTAFLVEASPVEATEECEANPAHAHIKSAVHRGKAGLRQIRLLLLRHLQNLVTLDEYMAGVASNDDGWVNTPPDASVSADPDGAA
ncbi:hypothetical protein MKL09_25240 [Methylobacterium sp. J-048]|uniref:hypothetical protein n=1 Tax=Methylobacterium sp. J-048 TaxID=2836635 RepID=UPI001FBB05E8|nr:hypothetical protein [Methylobacterium sp. J-048]MCJ2059822.1 hypothetical protein [Methylobacterium sp. J-048]